MDGMPCFPMLKSVTIPVNDLTKIPHQKQEFIMFSSHYRILIVCLFWIVFQTTQAYSEDCVHGNNIPTTEKRPAAAFHTVNAKGAFDIDIRNRQSVKLTVTADQNLLPSIITKVEGGTLYIYADRSICTKRSLAILIEGKDIQKIQSSGANDISYSDIQADKLEIIVDDAGEIHLSGKSKTLIARLSDAADMEAENLRANEVDISASGACDATVYASKKLNAVITGSGTITVHGNPEAVTKKISDAGELVLE